MSVVSILVDPCCVPICSTKKIPSTSIHPISHILYPTSHIHPPVNMMRLYFARLHFDLNRNWIKIWIWLSQTRSPSPTHKQPASSLHLPTLYCTIALLLYLLFLPAYTSKNNICPSLRPLLSFCALDPVFLCYSPSFPSAFHPRVHVCCPPSLPFPSLSLPLLSFPSPLAFSLLLGRAMGFPMDLEHFFWRLFPHLSCLV